MTYCPYCTVRSDGIHENGCPNGSLNNNFRRNMIHVDLVCSECEQLKNALREMIRHAEFLRDSDVCDHSVNICWCEYFKSLEAAQQLLEERLMV